MSKIFDAVHRMTLLQLTLASVMIVVITCMVVLLIIRGIQLLNEWAKAQVDRPVDRSKCLPTDEDKQIGTWPLAVLCALASGICFLLIHYRHG